MANQTGLQEVWVLRNATELCLVSSLMSWKNAMHQTWTNSRQFCDTAIEEARTTTEISLAGADWKHCNQFSTLFWHISRMRWPDL